MAPYCISLGSLRSRLVPLITNPSIRRIPPPYLQYPYQPTLVNRSFTTGDDTSERQGKERKTKWNVSYSKMTRPDSEKRLGIRLDEVMVVPVDQALANMKHHIDEEVISSSKEEVYKQLVRYLEIEGYPTDARADFKEANVSDLVFSIISPILFDFKRNTGRKVRLEREKEIIANDGVTGGMEEFVVMDRISLTEERFILIVEGKRSSVGEAMKQCLLSLKDARDSNGCEGKVYGFITTGESWHMISYDGEFQMTEKMVALFHTMSEHKRKWMENYSLVVDCMYGALGNGGG